MSSELFPGKHLFVDDYRIEDMRAARRVLKQAQKHPDNPVLRPEQDWEEQGLHLGKLLYDRGNGTLRAWYTSSASTTIGTRILVRDNPPRKVRESHICYAESHDGIHWERPATGIAEQERYPDNNIVIQSLRHPGRAAMSDLIDDPLAADPQQRFKLMYLDQAEDDQIGGGLAPDQKLRLHACSPDGIHWNRYPWAEDHLGRLFGVIAYLDEVPRGALDPDARYILYGQRGSPWKTRQIGRRDSNDFLTWSENRPVLESGLDDLAGQEFYCLEGAVVNSTYAGLHLGMLGAYYTDLSRKFDPTRNDGFTETQLAFSRDSLRWQRWPEPFIPRGPADAFDWGGAYCGYPVFKDEAIYFLYTGESGRHGKPSLPAIGLATLRLDGFVAVRAEGFMEGTLTTRPHHWKARALHLNVDAGHVEGKLWVQLQDETGRALDGFGREDCDPLHADTLDQPLTWKGRGDLGLLHDRMIALKFFFTPGVELYSYTLKPLEDE